MGNNTLTTNSFAPAKLSGLTYSTVAWFGLLVGLALIAGIGVAIGFSAPIAVLIGLPFLNIIALFILLRKTDWRDSLFWIWFLLIFMTALAQKQLGQSFGFLIEASILGLLPVILILGAKSARSFRLQIALYFVFLGLSLASALSGESQLFAGAFQVVTDAKPIVFLIFGSFLAWTARTERTFWALVRFLWLPFSLLVIWQWVSPGSYYGLIHKSYGGLADPLGIVPSRGLGPFNHAATLAAVVAMLGIMSLVRARLFDPRFYLPAIMYLFLLLSTTQRVEFASVFFAIGLWKLFAVSRGRAVLAVPLVAAALVGAVAVVAIQSDAILAEARRSGEIREFLGEDRAFRPRPVFYVTSFEIASDRFPLGSGPGTFGGAGAGKFDWSYYQKLGLTNYSWFSPTFLFETYWPHLIAESGWFGVLVYLSIFGSLLLMAFRKCFHGDDRETSQYWEIAGTGLIFMLLNSINGPVFEDPTIAFFVLPFFGIAAMRPTSGVQYG